MGITVFTIVISGGVSSNTFANQGLWLRSRVVVKLNFGPFSRWCAPSNENFKHSNPLNVTVSIHVRVQILFLVDDSNTTKSGSPSLFKWRFVAGPTLNAGFLASWFFRTIITRKPYFRGGGGVRTPCPPLDPRMPQSHSVDQLTAPWERNT